jgi:hypothetical protein
MLSFIRYFAIQLKTETMKTRISLFSKCVIVTLLFVISFATETFATHFRYGSISSRVVSGRTIEFKVAQSYRRSFYGTPVVGSVVSTETFYFGDGTTTTINLTVTAINTTEDWFYGEAIITRTYATNGTYTAYFNNCCRLSTLLNNPDGNYYVWNRVCVNNTVANNAPVSSMPPIVNMAVGQAAATFTVPATDPDGTTLTFRLATLAETGGSGTGNPAGLSINSTTGVMTFNTVGKTIGQQFSASIVISDGCNSIINDFLIRIVNTSTPPAFDYSVTPANAFLYQVSPGQNITFTVRATDVDAGDIVTLQALGLPSGSTMTPSLPRNGNPVQSVFSWTPTVANFGTSVITFSAQDAAGVQRTTTVSIIVSLRPQFDVPPTPADASVTGVAPGTLLSITVRASDPDPLDKVRITSATVPAGATLAPGTPTTLANPTSTAISWTPTISQ